MAQGIKHTALVPRGFGSSRTTGKLDAKDGAAWIAGNAILPSIEEQKQNKQYLVQPFLHRKNYRNWYGELEMYIAVTSTDQLRTNISRTVETKNTIHSIIRDGLPNTNNVGVHSSNII